VYVLSQYGRPFRQSQHPGELNQITMAGKDNWLLSNKTWLKWTALNDGGSLKYNRIFFTNPKDGERLKKYIYTMKKHNNVAMR
jgi:hypothetical protein